MWRPGGSISRRNFLEGRWAQLTVDAHIAHAIDYSRRVKPFIERVIHDELERRRIMEFGKVCGTNETTCLTDEAAMAAKETALPWIFKDNNKTQNSTNTKEEKKPLSIDEKINILGLLNKQQ